MIGIIKRYDYLGTVANYIIEFLDDYILCKRCSNIKVNMKHIFDSEEWQKTYDGWKYINL